MTGLIPLGLDAALTFLALYGVLCGLVSLVQRRILYLSWFIPFRTPAEPCPAARQQQIASGGVSLAVWSLHVDKPDALIYFGGSAEDVRVNLVEFDAWFPDRAVFLMSYRGYPGSTGGPSEASLTQDAETLFDWVAARHSRVTVLGKSLGTGVAVPLATRRRLEKLILVTPFDTLTHVAEDLLPCLPVRWLMRDGYESVRRIGEVRTPVLVVLAGKDGLVLPRRSDALVEAIPAPWRQVRRIEEASHTNIRSFSDYGRILRECVAGDPAAGRTGQTHAAPASSQDAQALDLPLSAPGA